MLQKLGQHAKAAELFLKGEDNEKAALAFEQAGDAVRAATLRGEHAFKSDSPAEAAAWFVKGRDFLRAAELYESIGMMPEAASAYEAGESWAAAGSVYIRAGLKDRAAAAYEKGGELETAAALFHELGNVGKAADLFERAGQTFRSGEAAARAGEREKAISLLQRVAAERRELPCGDRAFGAALHRDRPAGAGDREAAQVDRQRADLGREPRLPLLAGARQRSCWRPRRGARALQAYPGRGPAVPRREPARDAAAVRRTGVASGRAGGARPRRPRPCSRPCSRRGSRRCRGTARVRGSWPALRSEGGDRPGTARHAFPGRGRDRRTQRRDADAEPGAPEGAAVRERGRRRAESGLRRLARRTWSR